MLSPSRLAIAAVALGAAFLGFIRSEPDRQPSRTLTVASAATLLSSKPHAPSITGETAEAIVAQLRRDAPASSAPASPRVAHGHSVRAFLRAAAAGRIAPTGQAQPISPDTQRQLADSVREALGSQLAEGEGR